MLSVKLPNGRVIECDAGHYENVIKYQHPASEIVEKNTTKNVSSGTKEVVAEAPIQKSINLYTMEKNDLEAYALEKYGVNLDKRRGLEKLVAQVEKLGG